MIIFNLKGEKKGGKQYKIQLCPNRFNNKYKTMKNKKKYGSLSLLLNSVF